VVDGYLFDAPVEVVEDGTVAREARDPRDPTYRLPADLGCSYALRHRSPK
jgi:hypothetical protein